MLKLEQLSQGTPQESSHIRNRGASFGEDGIVNGINIIKNESTNICYCPCIQWGTLSP